MSICPLVWLKNDLVEHSATTSVGGKKTTVRGPFVIVEQNLKILSQTQVQSLLKDGLTCGTRYHQEGAHRTKDTFCYYLPLWMLQKESAPQSQREPVRADGRERAGAWAYTCGSGPTVGASCRWSRSLNSAYVQFE